MPPKRKAAKATGKSAKAKKTKTDEDAVGFIQRDLATTKATGTSAKAKKTKTDEETVGFIQRDLAKAKATRTSSRAKKALTEEDARDEALELVAASRSTRASARAKKAQAEMGANDDIPQDSAMAKTTKTSDKAKNARTEKASDDDFPRNTYSLFGEVVNRALKKGNTAEDSEEEDSSDGLWEQADRRWHLENDDDDDDEEEEEEEEEDYDHYDVLEDMNTAEPTRTWGQPKRVGFLVDDNDEDEDYEDGDHDEIQRQRARKRRHEAQAWLQLPEDDSGDVPEDVVAAEPARVWSRADGFQFPKDDKRVVSGALAGMKSWASIHGGGLTQTPGPLFGASKADAAKEDDIAEDSATAKPTGTSGQTNSFQAWADELASRGFRIGASSPPAGASNAKAEETGRDEAFEARMIDDMLKRKREAAERKKKKLAALASKRVEEPEDKETTDLVAKVKDMVNGQRNLEGMFACGGKIIVSEENGNGVIKKYYTSIEATSAPVALRWDSPRQSDIDLDGIPAPERKIVFPVVAEDEQKLERLVADSLRVPMDGTGKWKHAEGCRCLAAEFREERERAFNKAQIRQNLMTYAQPPVQKSLFGQNPTPLFGRPIDRQQAFPTRSSPCPGPHTIFEPPKDNSQYVHQMNPQAFSTTFNPYDVGIIDTVTQLLLPTSKEHWHGTPLIKYRVNAVLSGLNIHSAPSAVNDEWPSGKGYFATLVVCLPAPHQGGQLTVKREHSDGRSIQFDWSTAQEDEDYATIHWAAYHASCKWEIAEVTAGNRVTLVYELYDVPTSGLVGLSPALDASQLPLYQTMDSLLGQKKFMKYGGYIGFFCVNSYPHTSKNHAKFPEMLRGLDMAIYETLAKLNLSPTIQSVVIPDLLELECWQYAEMERELLANGSVDRSQAKYRKCKEHDHPAMAWLSREHGLVKSQYKTRGNCEAYVKWAKDGLDFNEIRWLTPVPRLKRWHNQSLRNGEELQFVHTCFDEDWHPDQSPPSSDSESDGSQAGPLPELYEFRMADWAYSELAIVAHVNSSKYRDQIDGDLFDPGTFGVME